MTMSTLTLRVPSKTLSKIKSLAAKERITVTDYILSKADPSYVENSNILQVADIIDKLNTLPSGHVFNLKSLYSKEEWTSFSAGSRISTGRLFYQSYDQNLYGLRDKVEFLKKDSANLAQYRKL